MDSFKEDDHRTIFFFYATNILGFDILQNGTNFQIVMVYEHT